MRAEGCWECGAETEDLHDHRVIPRSRGGMKTVPICTSCHGKAHHLKKNMAISRLSREGIARAKARGVKLGGPNPEKWAAAGRASIQTKTDAFHVSARPAFEEIMNIGCVYTLSGIADCLNSRGIKTRRGGVWFASSVSNAFKRFEALGQPLAR